MHATRETLAQRLRLGPLSAREATHLGRALLSAIEHTPHGAIAPENIVLDEGKPLLGSAGASAGGSRAADLYAVGALLYESVSGRTWTPGADPDSADWSGIPHRLRRVLRRALSTAPQRRWPDAASFERALWVPRPADTIWPAVVVILLGAAIISVIVACKPLGLCWERRPPPAGTR